MRRPARLTAGAAVATAVIAATLGTGSVAAVAAADPNTDGSPAAGVDQSSAIVVLSQAPLSTAPGTRNAKGRVDMNKQETKSAQAQLAVQRNSLKAWLRDNAPRRR
jgi:minor extracellular serine protease Vpr